MKPTAPARICGLPVRTSRRASAIAAQGGLDDREDPSDAPGPRAPAGAREQSRQREHRDDDERGGGRRAGGEQERAPAREDSEREQAADERRGEEVHRARQDVEGDCAAREALGRHAGAAQRPRGKREPAGATGGQQHVRALRGHADLVAQAPRQAPAEDTAEGGDERQTRGRLEQEREDKPGRRRVGEPVADLAETGKRGDRDAERGEDGRDERKAQSQPAAVGEGDRRRRTRRGHGHGHGHGHELRSPPALLVLRRRRGSRA